MNKQGDKTAIERKGTKIDLPFDNQDASPFHIHFLDDLGLVSRNA